MSPITKLRIMPTSDYYLVHLRTIKLNNKKVLKNL